MYLSYVDESGYSGSKYNPNQPVFVMTGILPNIYNYHRSDTEFRDIFNIINSRIPISEIKGEQIYRGRGSWNSVPPELRDCVIQFYLDWIKKRNHKFIISAIDNETYFNIRESDPENLYINQLPCPYLLSALHIAIVIQKLNRKLSRNKGKSLLIFDEQEEFSNQVTELLFSPPEFIDEFVPFNERREKYRLSQIIDTAFFVKSHQSSMAQVVDVVAYLFRLHLELSSYEFNESYEGEIKKISNWIDQISDKFIPFNKTYPHKGGVFIDFINSVKAKGI